MKKVFKLISGVMLSSLGITMVIHANLGVFPITSMNMAISNWLGISIGTAGCLVELIILLLAYKLGEGLSLMGIVNMSLGSFAIDLWTLILPKHPLMIVGIFLLPIAWWMSSSTAMGDTNQNLLTNAILKRSKKSMGLIRGIQETLFMIIGLIGSQGAVTPLTVVL